MSCNQNSSATSCVSGAVSSAVSSETTINDAATADATAATEAAEQNNMMPMTVFEIAAAVKGTVHVSYKNNSANSNRENIIATSVFTDSRQVRKGSVFVAIAGEHVDGHDYVKKAEDLGAVLAIVEHVVEGSSIVQIVVKNCVQALGMLAKHNLERRRELPEPFTIIGITGSVGKTTTKDMLHALLNTLGSTVAPVGSFNNNIGLPLTALKVGSNTRFLVAEMGANHVGEIENLTRIAPPDIAVVLKVGVAHLGEFGSVERIAQAKSEIVRGLVPHGLAVLNSDDSRVSAMSSLVENNHVRWFGRNIKNDSLESAQSGEYELFASEVELDALGKPVFTLNEVNNCESNCENANQTKVHLAIQGEHNVMNALAAANVARYFGMSLENIAYVLSKVSHISPHRMQLSTVSYDGKEFTLIDDSFNANPDSMKAGIDGLCAYEHNVNAESSNLFRIAVLGSMLELGENECELHANIGSYAVNSSVDAVIAVGSETDSDLDRLANCIVQGARDSWVNKKDSVDSAVRFAHSAKEADSIVWKMVAEHPSSVVLLKGSHASGLSVLAERWAKLPSFSEQTDGEK